MQIKLIGIIVPRLGSRGIENLVTGLSDRLRQKAPRRYFTFTILWHNQLLGKEIGLVDLVPGNWHTRSQFFSLEMFYIKHNLDTRIK